MRLFPFFCLSAALVLGATAPAFAVGPASDVAKGLAPHKALYDIDLVATRSGSQVINISGKMFYEWKPSCDAWITDHRFNLFYEYADSPGMRIMSDFSTFEMFDGSSFDYTSRRKRDGELYQELRGRATLDEKGGEALFTMPDGLSYDLSAGAMFPMAHTVKMIEKARAGKKFFSAEVFDGSDEEGPIEINTFIGKKVKGADVVSGDSLDKDLLKTPAWNVRMAVFPLSEPEESSDYEMSVVFHDNGVISDMLIEYDDFSVTQKLVALEKLEAENCGGTENASGKAKKQ